MNGETHDLESAHKVTIASDSDGRATITVQGGGLVAVAHLTPGEAVRFASSVFEMAEHLDPSACPTGEPPEVEELRRALADAGAKLQEGVDLVLEKDKEIAALKGSHETAVAALVAELEAAKAAVCGHAPDADADPAPDLIAD